MFIVTFFFFRVILVPYLWVHDVRKLLEQEQTEDYCLPYYFSKVVLCLGPFFHLLNAFCKYSTLCNIECDQKWSECDQKYSHNPIHY